MVYLIHVFDIILYISHILFHILYMTSKFFKYVILSFAHTLKIVF